MLGVDRGAGPDEIRRAYLRLARRHHPDVSAEPGAQERFKEIAAAYRTLAGRIEIDLGAEVTVAVEVAFTGGRGRVTVPGPAGRPRQYDVAVPAGVADGVRLRLAGGLLLVVRLAPHPRLKVSGRDVMVEVPVSPWEAALGAAVPLALPAGDLRLDVPPGSSSGRRLRLRGHGLPNPRGPAGDLFTELRIVVPRRLTPGEHALFTRLASESPFDPRQF
ncbi:DnaJ C-terminal domain-containing protein [Dactylosporangium sp. CA-233914]|uniref:DnaJ C-terminal domain-containing protein n=1 Tax=Dactylosporangium sp. CA-233914 TaxID=3239934 RepID=UPI003D8EE834